MALGNKAITKDSIFYQAGRGGDLLVNYELARVNTQFASGAIANRDYNLGTATTVAVAPFVVPRDTFITEIRGFVQNQTADITTFDVHYSEPASGQYTIFRVAADRPSTVTGAVSIASGAPAVSTTIARQEWLAGTPIWVYADAQGANASGAVVQAIGRTVKDPE